MDRRGEKTIRPLDERHSQLFSCRKRVVSMPLQLMAAGQLHDIKKVLYGGLSKSQFNFLKWRFANAVGASPVLK